VLLAARYDKGPVNYLAAVQLASIHIWCRFDKSLA